jgi:hypothetical protein
VIYLHICLHGSSAGGGTRTLTLFRARAPKARVSAKFHHARSVVILSPCCPTNLSAELDTLTSSTTRGALMRSAEEFNEVQRLIAAGMNDCEIARQTGIPRKTAWEWRRQPRIRTRPTSASPCRVIHDFSAMPAAAYCYVLGLYRGDACISRSGRVWHMRITLDKKYPAIIDRCRDDIDRLMQGQRAAVMDRSDGCSEVSLYSKHWPCLRPQHRPGKKHTRPIRLEPWQEVFVKEATEEFIRGLIHSDGCRVVANDRGVKSVRYHFSNPSEDIIGLFTDRARRPRYPVDTVEQEDRLHLPQGRRRPPRRVRRAEVLSGTVDACPLHGVAGQRSSRW